jgi:hypothetical protein
LSPLGAEELTVGEIQEVIFQEVVRECIVEDGMFCIEPFSVEDIAIAQYVPKGLGMDGGPLFEQVEVFFPWAACEVMATALQPQVSAGVKADGGVGTVYFFFDDVVTNTVSSRTTLVKMLQ